jgi:hypothetical protein
MLRKFATTTAIALLLGTSAMAEDAPTVKSVEVVVDIASVQNPEAAKYWSTISDDLKNEILTQLTDRINDDGVDVNIDIEEVELSNGFQDMLGLANTVLAGSVKISHSTDNTRFSTFDLKVDVNQAMPMLPVDTDVTLLPADTRAFYDAMIKTFAKAVVDRLV